MPSVDDFKKSLRDMDEDELNEHLDTTRNNRTSSKSQSKTKQGKKKEKEKTSDEDPDDLDDLTPDQAQELLNRLQNS